MPIRLENVTEHANAFGAFKRLTSLLSVLNSKERFENTRFLVSFIITIATFLILFEFVDPTGRLFGHRWSDHPGTNYAPACTAFCLIPILYLLVLYYSDRIKKLLQERGIDITTRLWNGPVLDRMRFASFTEYLQSNGWLNRRSLSDLIEAARDEIIFATRLPTLTLAFLAVIISVGAAIGCVGLQIWLEKTVRSAQDLSSLVEFISLLVIIVLGFPPIIFFNSITSRTELETYLQCLHALRFNLPEDVIRCSAQVDSMMDGFPSRSVLNCLVRRLPALIKSIARWIFN